MSARTQSQWGRIAIIMSALVAFLCSIFSVTAAQDQPAPKWELYGGYSFFDPGANVHGVLPGGLLPVASRLEVNPRGAGASVTYDFNRWFGLSLDASTHWGSGEKTLGGKVDDVGLSNLSIGPKFTLRRKHFSPFLEGLVGAHRLMPETFHHIDKLGLMAGGGLDFNLSKHVALRLVRADYVFSDYNYGPSNTTRTTEIRGVRLQAGLNFMFGGGGPAPIPPSAECAASPVEVFAGEPVAARANGSNFNPRRPTTYNWSGTGVKVAGTDASTQIDTTGLQPGSYQVSANLSDGSKNGVASCSASFTVKRPQPPVISCSADPSAVTAGGTTTIRSTASSPDNRALSYSYSASAGNVSGTDASASLNTSGAQPGPITVTCSVNDDRNPPLTASASTMVNVNVEAPPPAPPAEVTELETKLALRSVYFKTARPTNENPTGGLVKSQEEVLASLASGFIRYLTFKPDAHLTLEGHADPRGSVEYNQALSQRRVERTQQFLIEHGVPAANIETKAFGEQHNLTDAQVRDAVESSPELSPENRRRILKNMTTIILASNRRVDITLSTTGQKSLRQFPFNAADSLTLLNQEGTSKMTRAGAKKKPKSATQR